MPARNPRIECGCQSVAVISLAIVAPAGARNITIACACLVGELAAGFDDTDVERLRETVETFRALERVAAFGLYLGLVMGIP